MKSRLLSGLSIAAIEEKRQVHYVRWFIWTYWIVIAAHFFAQLFCFWWLPYQASAHYFYLHILTYPTLLMSAATAVTHMILQYKAGRYSFYFLFVAGTIIEITIIHLNEDIRIIGAIMLLPIFASTIFFRLRLACFTSLLQVLGFVCLYRWDESFHSLMSMFDLVGVMLFLAVSTLIAGMMIVCGRDLVKDLEAATGAQRRLLVENTVMSQQSKRDALTGLYNHMSFHEFYDKALEFADQGAPFHLALIDIDSFKSINDTYGHRVGDLILARVARVIQESISPADIAARYGGEEFALLLFEQTFDEAYALVDRIRAKLAATTHAELRGQAVTVSVGIQSYSSGTNKERLFEAADALLYTAKRSGKNKVAFHAHAG